MYAQPPSVIAIAPDDYHAKHVGHTADGRQFFLTTPFTPPGPSPSYLGAEFVALYLFDAQGALLEARIDSFGPLVTMDYEARNAAYDRHLESLGTVSHERINIAPFSIERFALEFGLILWEPEEEDGKWYATIEPGDYMAFFAPWDSGKYDT